jgi:dynein heavy chain
MTLESPIGIKANVLRMLNTQKKNWDLEIDAMKQNNKDYEYSKFLISLMHFHSILLVRKNYGPLGWNIKYNFNDSDFLISKNILKYNIEKNDTIPYKALIYLTADCIYGGRVTDDWDRRTLFSLLNDFYNKLVLKFNEYKINNNEDYVIPYLDSFEEYVKKIEKMPIEENPEIIGLNKNALIRREIEETNSLLISLAGLEKGNSTESNSQLSIIKDIDNLVKKKLPKNINIEIVKKKFPIKKSECMNSILIQEIMRYNKLLNLIYITLEDLVYAYKGLIPLTDEIEEISTQIISNITPKLWIKSSYPSKKPIGSWIEDLSERLNFFNIWIENGLPYNFWFSAFYFTQSFLTGIKQNFARRNKISIDQLEFNFKYVDNDEIKNKFENDIKERIAYSTYGLFIEGAQWNSEEHIVDELCGKNINSKMPTVI